MRAQPRLRSTASASFADVGHVPVPLTTEHSAMLQLVGCVQAGFPSPADDYNTKRVDLNEILITHPQATFLTRAKGVSMREAGIDDDDVLVVNRALKPKHGHVVIALVDAEYTVKRLFNRFGRFRLCAANPTYPDIVPKEGQTIEVWGVATACIKLLV